MEPLQLHQMSAKDAAREQALRLTQHAAEACLRLHHPEDVEALHDFRVGVRRLRTFLRAYGPALDLGKKKTLKGLKRLAQSTNESRDLEVGIDWLGSLRGKLGSRQRVGLNWLLERLEAHKAAAYERVRAEIPSQWARTEARLRRRLSFPFTGELSAGTFGQVSAGLIVAAAARLEQGLSQIESVEDAAPAHEARICAKRLRYLLEPFRSAVPQTKPVVRELRRLQDTFGELNDAHVMLPQLREAAAAAAAERATHLFELGLEGPEDPRTLRAARNRNEQSGLLELARLARTRQQELFAHVHECYLEGRATGLLGRVREVADALAAVERVSLRLVRSDQTGSADGTE
jgi:CHAD domain-containing protein